ncbi:MAG: FtsX-like permease family protein [Cytophagales bacterium]|nr:FtsX-like permease family protein [Cytophagales bacterium]
MFTNFLKTTVRNMLRNRAYVIINIVGLGLSLACCIVGYLNFKYAADFDKNHENHASIYKIQINKTVQGRNIPYGISPLPLGHEIKNDLAGVSQVVRYSSSGMVMQQGEKILNKRIGFADEDLFEMFTFPFKYGDKSAFLNRGNLILSENTAQVYFGDVDPTGELIKVIESDGTPKSYVVGGVLEKIPSNSSINFHAVTLFDNYLDLNDWSNDRWRSFVAGTFIKTTTEEFPGHIPAILDERYVEIQNSARDDWKVAGYYLEQLTTLGKNAQDIRANWLSEPPPVPAVISPLIMSIMMLLIACFNFTNTSLAISSKRLKEIGVRKVMGGNRNQLIFQFMGENIALCIISMLLALLISVFLVPAYSSMWDFLELKLSLTENPEVSVFLTGLLLFTAITAGAYPSLYVSSYEPVSILRGSLKVKGTSTFSKILLGAQYSFTFLALISSLAFIGNAEYQKTLDVGFQKDGIIAVQLDSEEFQTYFDRANQISSLEMVAGTEEHIGRWNYARTLRQGEKEMETSMMDLGLDYLDLMDLTLVEGRYFEKDLKDYDRQSSIVVNEQLVKDFGWQEPIGKRVQIDDSTRLTVVGVLKDFYAYGFWDPVSPMAFRPALDDRMNFVVARMKPENSKEAYEALEAAWYEMVPNKPFNGDYQDEFIKESNLVNNNIAILFTFLGTLALILSSIGLFTLVSLNVIKRIKEIGIRKVLGAKVSTIIHLLNRPFIIIISVSAVIGTGMAFLLIDLLLSTIFHYYQAVTIFSLVLPFIVLSIISLTTSSGRVLVAAKRNPVESLRYE